MKFITNLWKNEKMEIFSIFTIALPTIVDLFVQTLLSFFDLIMVGRLGPDAIAAVGIGNAPILTIIPLFFAISIGTNAMISRAFGSNNFTETKAGMSQSLILGIPIATVVLSFFLMFGRPILELISKNQSVDSALSYLNVISLGIPSLCFNIIFAYGFRAIRKAKIPMIANIITLTSNVILNYIFIFILELGVVGAAIATTISRVLATIVFVFFIIFKQNYCISLSKKDFYVDTNIWKRLLKIGLPTAYEQGLLRIGILIFEAFVINLGTLQYAAHKIALTAESFSFNIGSGFAIAGTSLIGHYIGSKDYTRAKKTTYLNMLLAMFVMTIFGFSFMFFPKFIISMFTDKKNIIPMATSALRIVSIVQPVLAMSMVLSGALRGAGDTKSVLLITFFCVFLLRLPLAYLFIYTLGLGLNGAWFAMIVDLTVRGLFCLNKFKKGKWRYIKV